MKVCRLAWWLAELWLFLFAWVEERAGVWLSLCSVKTVCDRNDIMTWRRFSRCSSYSFKQSKKQKHQLEEDNNESEINKIKLEAARSETCLKLWLQLRDRSNIWVRKFGGLLMFVSGWKWDNVWFAYHCCACYSFTASAMDSKLALESPFNPTTWSPSRANPSSWTATLKASQSRKLNGITTDSW